MTREEFIQTWKKDIIFTEKEFREMLDLVIKDECYKNTNFYKCKCGYETNSLRRWDLHDSICEDSELI